MAEIQPFQAVCYSKNVSDKLDKLITPPYDVISPQEQDFFYSVDDYNIIRLVLGKIQPDDNEHSNKYSRAAAHLSLWLQEGILVKDEDPSFVVYQMEFQHPESGKCVLDGLVSLVAVDDYGPGRVLPHEKTYKGPKMDQLSLMRACRANLTPIHALYDDVDNEVRAIYAPFTETKPELEAVDRDGTIHRIWKITDRLAIAKIREFISPLSLVIADGHHRYETALAYKREIESSAPHKIGGPEGYVMTYLTSMSHPGLTILPAHRMVKGLKEVDIQKIESALDPYFEINELSYAQDEFESVSRNLLDRIRTYSEIGGKFGMAVHGMPSFRLLKLRNFDVIDSLLDASIPKTVKSLDVTILREVIMAMGLKMDVENSEGLIEYTPIVSEALDKAKRGDVQISFILNPTRVDQMRVAAELGHKLPHKSTYFFPKISSGMVLNVF